MVVGCQTVAERAEQMVKRLLDQWSAVGERWKMSTSSMGPAEERIGAIPGKDGNVRRDWVYGE